MILLQSKAVIAVLQKLMELHGNAVFGGDGYSSEWHESAVRDRGLKNIPTTADALPALKEDYVVDLFKKTGVLSPTELASRFEVYSEQYILQIEVEAKLVIDMAKTSIYPAAIGSISDVTLAASAASELGVELDNSQAKVIADETNAMMAAVKELTEALAKDDFASK
jgi:glutamine synthetase